MPADNVYFIGITSQTGSTVYYINTFFYIIHIEITSSNYILSLQQDITYDIADSTE